MNEPVADAVRGFLDGHIVLSRKLANANHFPAVDALRSVSRLDRAVCTDDEIKLISEARDLLSVYRQNEDLINVGAYAKNSNPKLTGRSKSTVCWNHSFVNAMTNWLLAKKLFPSFSVFSHEGIQL